MRFRGGQIPNQSRPSGMQPYTPCSQRIQTLHTNHHIDSLADSEYVSASILLQCRPLNTNFDCRFFAVITPAQPSAYPKDIPTGPSGMTIRSLLRSWPIRAFSGACVLGCSLLPRADGVRPIGRYVLCWSKRRGNGHTRPTISSITPED